MTSRAEAALAPSSPTRSNVEQSNTIISSGAAGYSSGGTSISCPGRNPSSRGTAKCLSPNEATTRLPIERSTNATASIDPSASPSGFT